MQPYYQDEWVTIYHGDCREVLDPHARWPSGAWIDSTPDDPFDHHIIVTDPPYGISYEGAPANLGAKAYAPISGDNSTDLAEWVLAQPSEETVVFGAHEFPHLLKTGGRWFCWDKRLSDAADKMIGTPFELAWSSRDGANVMLRCLHGGVVNANDPGYGRVHPTEKPVPMLRRLLAMCHSGTVLDPFMGSGTTLRAAKDIGRKAIGIEIEERYCAVAAIRCAQEVLPLEGAV